MAKDKNLDLSIRILGKVDKRLAAAINTASKQTSTLSKTLSSIGTVGLATMTAGATATAAAIIKCTDEAEKFEKQMADVTKYVNGLADANGKISNSFAIGKDGTQMATTYAENYQAMKDALLDLSTQIPMTAEDLTRLAAAAGQSGKSFEDIIQYDSNGKITGFLRDAAMMGTAMDISADLAGDYAAKWEVAFDMNHDQIMTLSDQINYLGANTATTAAEIADVVNATGSLGQVGGIDDVGMTAALADAMLAMGVDAGKTSTAIKRMYINLSKGSSATKAQKTQWEELGFTAEGVAKSMQEDGVGTLQNVFAAIGNMAEDKRVAALNTLFGGWAIEGSAKMAGNLTAFTNALGMVSDQSQYTGSMEREFIIKSSTSDAINTMMGNAFKRLQINIGDAFLPVKKQLSLTLIDMMDGINDNLPQLQQLAGTLAELASGGISKLGEDFKTALPYIQKGLDYINNNGEKVAKILSGLAAAFVGMKFAPAAEGLLGGVGGALMGSGGAGGSAGLIGGLMNAGNLFTTGGMIRAIFGTPKKTGGTRGGLINNARKFIENIKGGAGGWAAGMKDSAGKMGPLTDFGTMMSQAKESFILTAIANPRTSVGGTALALPGQIAGGNLIPSVLAAGGSLLGNMNIGGTFSGAAGLYSGVFGGIWSAAGSLVGSFLPVTAAVTGVIALISILGDHLEDIRTIVGNVFGEQGLAVFDLFMDKIGQVGDFITGLFTDGGVANALAPVRDMISNLFGGNAISLDAFDGLTMVLQSVMNVVGNLVDFAVTTVKPIILDIFNFITSTVVPGILQVFTAAAPSISSLIETVGSTLTTVMSVIAGGINAALPVIKSIISALLQIGQVVIPLVIDGFTMFVGSVGRIVSDIGGVFNGLIEFITGVFYGNWEQAWNGIKEIFGSIFNGLVELCKTPINAIAHIINGVIEKINGMGVTIPDWVPGIGGKSFAVNLPQVPTFAQGGFTSGPSIAGEAGREAVISFDKAYRSRNIDTWLKAGDMLGIRDELKPLGELSGSDGGQYVFQPQIVIQGNADESTMDATMRRMKQMFDEWIRDRQRREARIAY